MSDYDGWKSTNEVFDVVVSFLLQDGDLDIARETIQTAVEKDRFLLEEFTVTGSATETLPDFDFDICGIKSDLPVDISKTDVYDITNSQFFYVRHSASEDTGTDRLEVTGTQDAGVVTTVLVLLIKEA